MNKSDNSAPQLTWPNIIGTLGVTLVLAGGAWALYQSQRTADREYLEARLRSFESREEERHLLVFRRQDELRERIQEVVKALHERTISKDQFIEFEKSFNSRWQTQADINRNALDFYLTSKAWETWRIEREKLINSIERRLNGLEQQQQR